MNENDKITEEINNTENTLELENIEAEAVEERSEKQTENEAEEGSSENKERAEFEFTDSSVPEIPDADERIAEVIWDALEKNKPVCIKGGYEEKEAEVPVSFVTPDGLEDADPEIGKIFQDKLTEAKRMRLLAEKEMVLIPVPGLVVFPHSILPIAVETPTSQAAVEYALKNDALLFLVARRRPSDTGTAKNTLYKVGCVCAPIQAMRFPNGAFHLVLNGIARASIAEITQHRPFGKVKVKPEADIVKDEQLASAYSRSLIKQFQDAAKIGNRSARELEALVNEETSPSRTADLIAFNLDFTVKEKQSILEAFEVCSRLKKVSALAAREIETLKLEAKIMKKAESDMNKAQKEYFLRQQIKAIHEELGEGVSEDEDIEKLRSAVEESGMPEDTAKHALRELSRLRRISSASPDYDVVYNYIDRLLRFPWNKYTEDRIDVAKAAEMLDKQHYGLKEVKERILEFLAVKTLKPDHHGPILCLVGPPGVGKTSLGKSVAEAMGRKFNRTSLGGVRDEAEIRGHRRTYVGAMPGRIIQAFCNAESKNPVIMLDEIDKVGKDYRGDPSDALLEALDPEQNKDFKDNYFGVPVDLSAAAFIMTANVMDTIPAALRDRMEVIRISGYTTDEKMEIGRRFLIDRQRIENGLSKNQFDLSDDALHCVIREYTREAGVRGLERRIADLCRKTARKITESKRSRRRTKACVLSREDVYELLGTAPFKEENTVKTEKRIGCIQGLSWTQAGGETLLIETVMMPGRGKVSLTGHLGKVMQESAKTAITWCRSFCSQNKIDFDYYHTDTHIHVPEGATPKDGPSAGIAMACGFISAASGVPARQDIAMTGEITLTGRAAAIGGVKEKVTAAFNAGITEVILPEENRSNLKEVPDKIREQMTFHFVTKAEEAVKLVVGDFSAAEKAEN